MPHQPALRFVPVAALVLGFICVAPGANAQLSDLAERILSLSSPNPAERLDAARQLASTTPPTPGERIS